MKYEQIAAYLRYYGESESIMGITRVTKRARPENDSKNISIGMGVDEQILSDQASYGLWGLYSAAMRDTGLVSGNERILTDKGLPIVRLIEEALDKDKITAWIKSKTVRKEELEKLAASFMKAIGKPNMCNLLVEALMVGSEHKHLQSELWEKTNELFKNKKLPSSLSAYVAELMATNMSGELKRCLQDICEVERVLVALNNIFHYCRNKDGVELKTIIQKLTEKNTLTITCRTRCQTSLSPAERIFRLL